MSQCSNYITSVSSILLRSISANKKSSSLLEQPIEIEKDRGSTEAIFHCLKRVTFELADLQGRSQLSVVFGTERLWHLALLYNLHSLLCRYCVLTVVFQPLLEKAGG